MLHKSHFLNAGFTLAELMAVVIIVAVLSAMASGSYKKAVERSRISDGLLAATAVIEAVNRDYAERFPASNTSSYRPKISQLDISFANQKACTTASDYCVKTKYFETTITKPSTSNINQYAEAKRMKGATAGDFAMRVYSSDFGSDRYKTPRCVGLTNTGKDLCVSAGYTSTETCGSYTCYYKP